jgi:acyl-ACP thioesterase
MYSIKVRVAASHTGENGCLKLVSAIDMMQDCSQLWLESEPVFQNYFRDKHIAQMLVSRQLDVIRVPAYGERLTVTTGVYECRSVYGFRNTGIYDEAGEPCFLCWCIGAFVNLDTGRPEKLPRNIAAGMTMDAKIDMDYLDRKIVMPADVPARKYPGIAIKKQDIDFNRHMNNARYVEMAFEYLPEDFETARLRIEYKQPSKYGDILYPRRIDGAAEKVYIALFDKEEKESALIEFTKK